MRIFDALLRTFGYLYHLGMGLFLAGIAIVSSLSQQPLNSQGMVALAGDQLTYGLLAIGLAGIVSVILAATGVFRWLFPLYATLAAFTIFNWFFASGFTFNDKETFYGALALFAGAIGAMFTSWMEFRRRKEKPHVRMRHI